MKTAMQQLIEWGDEMMLKHPLKVLSFAEAIDKAVELLEVEKSQIIKTYRDGRSDQQSERNTRWYNRNAEYYYNETYKGGQDGQGV